MKIPSYHILIFTILTKFYFQNFNFPPPSEGTEILFFTFLSNFLIQHISLFNSFFLLCFYTSSRLLSSSVKLSFLFSYFLFLLLISLSFTSLLFFVSLLYFTLFHFLILLTFTSAFQLILFPHFTLLCCLFILLSVSSSFHSFTHLFHFLLVI